SSVATSTTGFMSSRSDMSLSRARKPASSSSSMCSPFAPESRSTRTVTVMCPRATRFRSSSRTSCSQRSYADGSFRLGLKNLWFTARSSTLTREFPTTPSAVPNPVMLRIMDKPVNSDPPMRLSIAEAPPRAVDDGLSRHQVPGHCLVVHAEYVPVLHRDHSVADADLQ